MHRLKHELRVGTETEQPLDSGANIYIELALVGHRCSERPQAPNVDTCTSA